MYNGGYLVPANAKRGTLIFNIFRPFDLIMFATGVAISLIFLSAIPTTNLILTILFLLPAVVTGILVIPVPNYHNVMCALQSIFRFYSERRKYVWKGWCYNEQFTKYDKSKQ